MGRNLLWLKLYVHNMDHNESCGIPKERTSSPRSLSKDEELQLSKQNSRLVIPFAAAKLEENAEKHWDQFYKRNSTKFFKDRHWTIYEFKELLGNENLSNKTLLEVGCGVGNLIYPLINECPSLKVYACDFSKRAVDFVQSHDLYDSERITAFQGDITSSDLKSSLNCEVDLVSMVFVLSAIHPSKFSNSLANVRACLKTGGVILFRDYAINDMTQIRFKPGHKIAENFYMRQDGTRTYFFSLEVVREAATAANLKVIECYYVHSRTINKKENIDVPRVFVQAKFSKS